MNDKINKLVSLCKCSVDIYFNEHRVNYESVEQFLARLEDDEIPADIKQEMIGQDTIVRIIFFPRTPVCSVDVFHYDLNKALDEALSYFSVN